MNGGLRTVPNGTPSTLRIPRCVYHGRRFCIWAFVQTLGFWPEHLFWPHIIGITL